MSPAVRCRDQRKGKTGAWTVCDGKAFLHLSRAGDGAVVVRALWVAPNRRGQRVGTLAVRELLRQADFFNVEVRLWVDPFDKSNNGAPAGALHAFYVGMGFQLSRVPGSRWLHWKPA